MNIGIDARILERKMTGIGRFLKTFLDELPSVDKKNKYFLFSYEGVNFDNKYFTDVPTKKSILPQKLFAPIWNNFILPSYLKKNKIELFFSVNQQIPLVKVKNIKYILVLHDVIYKVDKNFHPFSYRKYLEFFTYHSIKSSDLIVTVSEYSKKDILKYYKVSSDKIKIVYEAVDKDFKVLNLTENERTEIRKSLNLPEQIILYVGVIENRKNIEGILKIADEIYEKNKNIKFVLIGKIGYGGEKYLKEIRKRENVLHLKNIDDKLLRNIYNVSSIFLFPSYYEGFGFPPLEAMQSGIPVIASNNTSLTEILGSGGLLHDANDHNAFVEDILRLLNDKEFYQQMREKGFENAKKYSINKTVQEFVKIFDKFAG